MVSITPAGTDAGGRPIVQIAVNVDEVVIEAVKLFQSARIQMELITNNVNDNINGSISDVAHGIKDIIDNVNVITSNIADSTASMNKPVLVLVIICILLVLLIVVVLFALLRVRREVHKTPIRLRRRRNNRAGSGKYRVDPLTSRPDSMCIDIPEPSPPIPPHMQSSSAYMRKPDTLV